MPKPTPEQTETLKPAPHDSGSETAVLAPPRSLSSRLFYFLFGRPLANWEGGSEQIGPLTGVPILGLDALSSASYGPEAALAILLPAGALGLVYLPGIMGAIICLMAILYFSYRQTIAAYPNGGGSFTVAKENLGKYPGLIAAAALLTDYVLNVAVGISAGVGALISACPALQSHTLGLCLGVLVLVTFVNLRGVRDSGVAWSIPTYSFVASLLVILILGFLKTAHAGGHPQPMLPPPPITHPMGRVGPWLVLCAFASGCTAMTGVEAVSNAVPIFAEPRVKNARFTLTIIIAILAVLLGGIAYLATAYHIGAMPEDQPNYQSVLSQLTSAIVGRGPLYFITIASVLAVLTLSANTSFADFPRVCSLLASDGFLPYSFSQLGRRLVYTTGILVLSLFAGLLLIVFDGNTDRLIPLFAIGAFSAFTMSQAGMVAHWKKEGGAHWRFSMFINGSGMVATGATLAVIIVAKFLDGAWIVLIVIPGLVALFCGIKRHYVRMAKEVGAALELQVWKVRPLSLVIPIESWNRVSEQAVRMAVAMSNDITVLHVTPQDDEAPLRKIWAERVEKPARQAGAVVPRLQIIHSPYRLFYLPILDFIKKEKKEKPDHLIGVVIPELVEPRWWEYFLHNNVAAGLKALLLLNGGERVVVISAPWYLRDRGGHTKRDKSSISPTGSPAPAGEPGNRTAQ
jgi:amino acid transporter